MDRGRGAAALLALATCIACSVAAPAVDNQALDLYKEPTEGCYYNFQHYREGDRIMTNEPCLNCTCHNKMLMCYLKVCPFTKAIGQDCTVEKRADQCCPIVTCPDVPVDLLTSTSTTSPAEYGDSGVVKADKYGCTIDSKYLPEGAKVPPTPNKPCEHCYCIRNMTTCVMQECTLHVDGCTPIYHKDVCCPVRYVCDHPEDEIPLLDDMTTTVRPTPGFILTTTTEAPITETEAKKQCIKNDQVYEDGARLLTENPCEHCFCMKGDVVCVVQECGMPMEHEGKSCTALPPRKGQCCPDRYICDGDELTSDSTAETPFDELNTVLPPKRIEEGSGYRKESDDIPSIEAEGSGEEPETQKATPVMMTETDILDDKLVPHEDIAKISTTPASAYDYETSEPSIDRYKDEEPKLTTQITLFETEVKTTDKTTELGTKHEIEEQDKYTTSFESMQVTTELSLQDQFTTISEAKKEFEVTVSDESKTTTVSIDSVPYRVGGESETPVSTEKLTYEDKESEVRTEKPAHEDKESEIDEEKPSHDDKESKVTTEKPTYEDEEPKITTEKPSYEDQESKRTTEKLTYEDKESEVTTEKPTYEDEKSKITTEKPPYEDQASIGTTVKPTYEDKESEVTTEKPTYEEEEPKITANKTLYEDQESKHTTEKPTYEDKKTEVTTEKPMYEDEEPKITTEKPSYEDQVSKRTTKKPPYEDNESKVTTEKPTYEDEEPKITTEKPSYKDQESKRTTERPPYEDKESEITTEKPTYEGEESKITTEKPLYEDQESKGTTVKSTNEDKKFEVITEKSMYEAEKSKMTTELPTYEEKEFEATTRKPFQEDKASKVTTEKPTYENKESEVSTGKPAYEDKKSEIAEEKPTHDDKESEVTTEKPTYEDKESKTTTGKPLYEDQESISTTEKSMYEVKEYEATTEKPKYEDKESKITTEKPSYEDQESKGTTVKSIYEDSESEVTKEKPMHEDKKSEVTTEKPIFEDQVHKITTEKPTVEEKESGITTEKSYEDKETKVTTAETTYEDKEFNVTTEKLAYEDQEFKMTTGKQTYEDKESIITTEKTTYEETVSEVTTEKQMNEDEKSKVTTEKQVYEDKESKVSVKEPTYKEKESKEGTSTSRPKEVTQEDILDIPKTTVAVNEISLSSTENLFKEEEESTPEDIDKLTTSIPYETTPFDTNAGIPSDELLPVTEQSTHIPLLIEESTSPKESQEMTTTEKPELPIPNPEENDISPAGRIPGEGDCLLNGIHYKNDTSVPSTNKCHSSCKCISSIVSCDPIICSMPPEYMDNCKAIYDTPDSCCPTFVCDQSKETVPPQPHSQMQGTEGPVSTPAIECTDDNCEVQEQTPISISPSSCNNDEDCKEIKSEEKPTCEGTVCVDEKVLESPEVVCDSQECKLANLPEIPQSLTTEIDDRNISESPKPDCYGQECKEIDTERLTQSSCEGTDCKELSGTSAPAQGITETLPEMPSCEGDGCMSQALPEERPACEGEICNKAQIPETLSPVCEGEACVQTHESIIPSCESEQCDKAHTPEIAVPECEGEQCDKAQTLGISAPVCDGAACITSEQPEMKPICEGEQCDKNKTPEIPHPECEGEACITSQQPEIKPSCEGEQCDKAQTPEVSAPECEGDACVTSQQTEIKPSCEGEHCDKAQTPEPSELPCESEACRIAVPETEESCEGALCNKVQTTEIALPVCEGDSCKQTVSPQVELCEGEECSQSQTTDITLDVQKETSFFEDTSSTILPHATEENQISIFEVTSENVIKDEPQYSSEKPYPTSKSPELESTSIEEKLTTSVPEVSIVIKSTTEEFGVDESSATMPTIPSPTQKDIYKEVESTEQGFITSEPSTVVTDKFTTESPRITEPKDFAELENNITEAPYESDSDKTTTTDFKQTPAAEIQVSTKLPEDQENEIFTKSPITKSTELSIITSEPVIVLDEIEDKLGATDKPAEPHKPIYDTKSPLEEQTTDGSIASDTKLPELSTEAQKEETEVKTSADISSTTTAPVLIDGKVTTSLESEFTTRFSEPGITKETEMKLEPEFEKTTQHPTKDKTTTEFISQDTISYTTTSEELQTSTEQPTTKLQSTEEKLDFTTAAIPGKVSKTPDDHRTRTEITFQAEEESTDKLTVRPETTKATNIPVYVGTKVQEISTDEVQTKLTTVKSEDETISGLSYEMTTAKILEGPQTSAEEEKIELKPTTDLLPVKFGDVGTEEPQQTIETSLAPAKEISSTEQTPFKEKTPSDIYQENVITAEPVLSSSQSELPEILPEEPTTIKLPMIEVSDTSDIKSTEPPVKDITAVLPEFDLGSKTTSVVPVDIQTEEPLKLTSLVPDIISKEDEFPKKVTITEESVPTEIIKIEKEQTEDKTEYSSTPITVQDETNKQDTQPTTAQKEKLDQTTPVSPDESISTQSNTLVDEFIIESSTKPVTIEIKATKLPVLGTTEIQETSDTTPYLVELEEHPHKVDEAPSALTEHEEPTIEISSPVPTDQSDIEKEQPYITTEVSEREIVPVSTESPNLTDTKQQPDSTEFVSDNRYGDTEQSKDTTIAVQLQTEVQTTTTIQQTGRPFTTEEGKEQAEKEFFTSTSKPSGEMGPEEEFIPAKETTQITEEAITQTPSNKFTSKPSEKPVSETLKPSFSDFPSSDELPTPEEENQFPPSGGYGQEPDYGDEDQAFGPGTCRYGGKIYVSAQQIPRDDPCDFCFCFRSDIICLQQSCPPPIHGCHEEPIQGFCCPRYECPVSMATTLNVTTTTTTTTTTLPPHFLPHAYKGAAQRRGCHIKGQTYKVGEVVRASSGPCLHCTCGGDGQMKCDPKVCTPEPMLRQMIAAAVSAKRRR